MTDSIWTHTYKYTGRDGREYVREHDMKRLPAEPVRALIEDKMERFHYSLRDISIRTGVPERTLDRVVNKRETMAHIDTCDKLCIELGTSLRDIYGE